MQSTWKVRKVDAVAVGRLTGDLGIHPVTARCLAGRGIMEVGAARSYLQPRLGHLRPPAGLADLPIAVDRLVRAVVDGQRIGIFGDYDVDGVTTAALLTSFLRQLGVSCVPRVARRAAGYGFGCSDADGFASAGCQLIITGDCGTSDTDAIERAAQRGVDVIVVDHHTVPPIDSTQRHPAVALVNPLRTDSTFPFRSMASVGLAFYLMAALRTALREQGHLKHRSAPDLRESLDLVALGTVADLVPLQGENRILTATGLRSLATRQRPGILALLDRAGVTGDRPVNERTISWKLGPRLNAPGRMGDAAPALALLLATDPEEAAKWADTLEEANDARRQAQERVLEEALERLGDADPGPAAVVAGLGWASGVTGIVATKLVEKYQRPAFVIAVDEATGCGRGSARSINNINLYNVLQRCADKLVRFGGHAAAAGLTIQTTDIEADIEVLRESLQHAVTAESQTNLADAAVVDAEVVLGDIDERLCQELEALAPFGKGNEKPLLGCRGMRVVQSRRVGDGAHLKLEVEDRSGVIHSGIGFGLGNRDPGTGSTIDATFAPQVNSWRGQQRVELEIREFCS